MNEKFECRRCDVQFDASKVENGKCPNCRRLLYFVGNPEFDPYASKSTHLDSNGTNGASFDDLVRAQNRTTYAIRSLAMFFFISIQTSILGGGLAGLALNNQSHYDSYGNLNEGATLFAIFGLLIALVGFYIALYVGRQELSKSKP